MATRRNRTLVVESGEIGIMSGGEFQTLTNFSMKILYAVKSPDGAKVPRFGFVYRVTRATDQEDRYTLSVHHCCHEFRAC